MSSETPNDATVAFHPDAVEKYLDTCIHFWRESDEEHAEYYVDAFQSVRTSLFGETLPEDDDE